MSNDDEGGRCIKLNDLGRVRDASEKIRAQPLMIGETARVEIYC